MADTTPESMRELVVLLRAMSEDEAVALLDTVAAGLVQQGRSMLMAEARAAQDAASYLDEAGVPVRRHPKRTTHPTKRSKD